MENASKALLIAGAILLAILLISLGIMVFNQGQDAIKNSGMSKAEIATFNSQFTKYEGTRRGSDVKALLQEVNASNASDAAEKNGRKITVVGSGTGTSAVTISSTTIGTGDSAYNTYATSSVQSTQMYKVTITGYDNSGFINQITIGK